MDSDLLESSIMDQAILEILLVAQIGLAHKVHADQLSMTHADLPALMIEDMARDYREAAAEMFHRAFVLHNAAVSAQTVSSPRPSASTERFESPMAWQSSVRVWLSHAALFDQLTLPILAVGWCACVVHATDLL